ncbi:aminopeptidase N [Alkalilimnicola ehrlichii]|uniref:aminopeptidase N n=1 Tax=Alkalilimnicola ehrlichii TaxID=351052 RepID=UPI003B9FC648
MTDHKQRAAVKLSDYTPPAFRVEHIDLYFSLGEEYTRVRSRMRLCRAEGTDPHTPLHLDGEALELEALYLDGQALAIDDYLLTRQGLTIERVPDRFELEVHTLLRPQDNTALSGLYRSGGMFCTQCEAEGFRRITYYPDRPDVLSRFTTTVEADRERYPVLLSNGNAVDRGESEGGRHWVRWDDPWPKPSYLFALVAGDLHCHRDRYRTASGRDVQLAFYVEHANAGRTGHAMESLKRAMRWDEETYGLEYDLDIYMVVAVGDFNMGAMENKGLNIFNTQYVLASPETATDADFEAVEAVIGHEYFHNYTGNRVTCRDWFQLSLKEGLTVFREQQFSEAMGSPAVQRIQQVRLLRSAQFPEDASPMAHPVRPDAYVEINNFYTATVYIKGAEVIRMYHTLLGDDAFRNGVRRYLERFDGQAVTIEDFLQTMAETGGRDLTQFGRWYTQAGTPRLRVRDAFDADAGRYTLRVVQECPPTPGQLEKQPFHIPLAMGLVGRDGQALPLRLAGEPEGQATTRVLELTRSEQAFVFEGLAERPVPSLLRGFSAPVILDYDYSDDDLAFLLTHDSDAFARWEAGQQLAVRVILRRVHGERRDEDLDKLRRAFAGVLEHPGLDASLAAEALALPQETYLAQQLEQADPVAIRAAREGVRAELAGALAATWRTVYSRYRPQGPWRLEPAAIAGRRLANLALGYLAATGAAEDDERVERQYHQADNMTDSLAALSLLADRDDAAAQAALDDFHQRWRHVPLVLDKWFRVQAMSRHPGALARVQSLLRHPDFDLHNPNRVRSVIGAFAQGNPAAFHDSSGEGYRLLADHILRLDTLNPQVAARMALPLSKWQRYDLPRQQIMKTELQRIAEAPSLSNDVYEVVSRSLENIA